MPYMYLLAIVVALILLYVIIISLKNNSNYSFDDVPYIDDVESEKLENHAVELSKYHKATRKRSSKKVL
ncbi:hypothetical protein [Clostridium sp. DMHC 10]|uniref:hypothetical protein n=1 Tax=Clostridium sp. DMHC 10 TaxID=747377 RepID=UPI000AA31DFD|nr:hypothetical protein [Clostridium sp. DMHC 10]